MNVVTHSSESVQVESPLSTIATRLWPLVFSIALLIAIAVLGVQLIVAGSHASALRAELAELRSKAGHLDVHDRSKVYVTRIATELENEWAWRIYLPGNHTFMLYNHRGRMRAIEEGGIHQRMFGSGSSGSIDSGEFILRFRLEERPDGRWYAKVISRTNSSLWGEEPRSSWLADRDWEESSAIPADGQREFPRDAAFDLIRLRQESAVDTNDQSRTTETIAVTISGASTNNP